LNAVSYLLIPTSHPLTPVCISEQTHLLPTPNMGIIPRRQMDEKQGKVL